MSFYQTGMGYRANVTLHSIRLFGLSGINLDESVVTRNENLTDIDIKLLFAFDELMLNGTYAMKVIEYLHKSLSIILIDKYDTLR